MTGKTLFSRYLRAGLFITFLVMTAAAPLAAGAAEDVTDDFTIDIRVNGSQLSEQTAITIDPEGEVTIDLHIFNVREEISLETVSTVILFAGQPISTFSEDLGSHLIKIGEDYRETIKLDAAELLKPGNFLLVTGIYDADVKLNYKIAGQSKTWSREQELVIPGNPLTTPAGAVAAVITAVTAAAAVFLTRSLFAQGVMAGASLPGNVSASSTPALKDFLSERLESTARGRVSGNIVKAAKSRVSRNRCPVCGNRIRHGYCYTCRKSAREIRVKYVERVKELAQEGAKLIAEGGAATLETICSGLGISPKLGTDVLVTLKKSKLVKMKGIGHKILGKALTTGIGSGLSAVLWITLGGFAALSGTVLIIILALSVTAPLALTRGLRIKAKRGLRKALVS